MTNPLDDLAGESEDGRTAPIASSVGPGAPERGLLRVNVYIDGFNLYFGCLADTPYRWLDVASLACHLLDPILPLYTLNHVRYFTAPIREHADKPGSAQRQQTYLRALSSIPNLTVHLGQFKTNIKSYMLADRSGFADVIRSEEKGSDVNLASYLITDGFDGCYDVALVVSNDTDLVLPIAMTRERLAVTVGVAAPCYFRNRRPMLELEQVSDFTAHILRKHKSCLQACQFPETVKLGDGRTVFRPSRWAPA